MSDPIEQVVERLDAQLGGFGPRRAGVLIEVRDGLEDAAAAYGGAGLPVVEARRRAVTDFGDPSRVAQSFRATDLGRLSRQTALLLGAGPVLVLTAWVLLGVSQGKLVTDSTVSGFGLLTAAGAAVGITGWWWTQRTLRQDVRPRRTAAAVAVAVLVLCSLTWVLSYAVEPWTSPADVRATGWRWVHAVEAFSMLTTVVMVAAAVRCLVATVKQR